MGAGAGFLAGFTKAFGGAIEQSIEKKRDQQAKERQDRLDALRATLSNPDVPRDAKAVVLNDYVASLKGHKEAQQAWQHFQQLTKMGYESKEQAPPTGGATTQQLMEMSPTEGRAPGPSTGPSTENPFQRSSNAIPAGTPTGDIAPLKSDEMFTRKPLVDPAEAAKQRWEAEKPEFDYKITKEAELKEMLAKIGADKAETIERMKEVAKASLQSQQENFAVNKDALKLRSSIIGANPGIDPKAADQMANKMIVDKAKEALESTKSLIKSRADAHMDRERGIDLRQQSIDQNQQRINIALAQAQTAVAREQLTRIKTGLEGRKDKVLKDATHAGSMLQVLVIKKDSILNNGNLTTDERSAALAEVDEQIGKAQADYNAAEDKADQLAQEYQDAANQQVQVPTPTSTEPLSKKRPAAKAAAAGSGASYTVNGHTYQPHEHADIDGQAYEFMGMSKDGKPQWKHLGPAKAAQ
jgi:hypothetical protein